MDLKTDIENKTISFISQEFEVDPKIILPNANMRDTLNLDSLDYVDLVVMIESNFGFKVTGEDFQTIHTFQDFYDYCYNKVKAKSA